MPNKKKASARQPLIKVVYFDEQSASDYLDISAGGKVAASSQDVRDRTTDMHARVETSLAAKFSWLPFIGASAETAAGVNLSSVGQSILSKTLSNTILTDYLTAVDDDNRIERLEGLTVTAPRNSMAYMKMYTPYMVIAKSDDTGIDLARLDEALVGAKGYYELLGESLEGRKCVLRFNFRAFRNNYGLTDLRRMRLVFHGVDVGRTTESALSMEAEMSDGGEQPSLSALEMLDGAAAAGAEPLLEVYDVILAGVEYDS